MEKFTIDITKPNALAKATEKILESVQTKTTKAAINTVNIQAAMTRKNAIKNIHEDLTIRNTFTERSIVFTQCPKNTKDYNKIQSQVGALERADYMERQEEGGKRKPKKGTHLAIPTNTARGGSRSNLIRPEFSVKKMKKVKKDKKNKTFRSKLVAKAYIAWKQNKVLNYNNNTFIVKNFMKTDGTVSFDLDKIYDSLHTETTTPATPWLEPATLYPAEQQQNIFNNEMKKLN